MQILKEKETLLKDYYKENKNKFVMYMPKGDVREKYQFPYSRVKNDIVDIFVDKQMIDWKKKLWNDYNINISENYFNNLEQKDSEKLRNAISNSERTN